MKLVASKTDLDFQNEIHQGLALNASLELAKSFLQRQMHDTIFKILSSEINISKKLQWTSDLILRLEVEQSELDEFFIGLQKKNKNEIEFKIKILNENSKKSDSIKLKLNIEKTELIS